MARHALPGSDRQPVAGARPAGRADPAERLEVSVILRSTAADALHEKLRKLASGDRAEARVERQDFARRFGRSHRTSRRWDALPPRMA